MSLSQELASVVRFTNISKDYFEHTHAFGDAPAARYGFQPGESKILPAVIAKHLAKHLARKMAIEGSANVDPRSRGRLFDDNIINNTINRILSDANHDSGYRQSTTEDIVTRRIAELNPSPATEPETSGEEVADIRSKQEIIEELEARGVKVDRRQSKEKLEEQLKSL